MAWPARAICVTRQDWSLPGSALLSGRYANQKPAGRRAPPAPRSHAPARGPWPEHPPQGSIVMGTNWRMPTGLHTSAPRLPVEGELPSFDGATGWLIVAADPSRPGRESRPGQLLDLYLHQLATPAPLPPGLGREILRPGTGNDRCPHTRVRVPAHAGNVRRAVQEMRIDYPVATDNNYAVWRAFRNNYWPALYFADAQGRLRHHYFGEGGYAQSEIVIQQLLAEAGSAGAGRTWSRSTHVASRPRPTGTTSVTENYTGYERTENFASPGGIAPGEAHVYAAPAMLRLNQWALSGDWTMEEHATTLNKADGQIACRFRARDLNIVMGWAGSPPGSPFRVLLDGRPPGNAHGIDVDGEGNGTVNEPRLYQLIRQDGPVTDRTFRSPSSTLAPRPSRSPSARSERSRPLFRVGRADGS